MAYAYLEMPCEMYQSMYIEETGKREGAMQQTYVQWERREYDTPYLKKRALNLSKKYLATTFRVHERNGFGHRSDEFWYYRDGVEILHVRNSDEPEYTFATEVKTQTIYRYDDTGRLHDGRTYRVENGSALFDYLMKQADDFYTIVEYGNIQRVIRKLDRKREEVSITEVDAYMARKVQLREADENSLIPKHERSDVYIACRALGRDRLNEILVKPDASGMVDYINKLADDIDTILAHSGVTGDEYLKLVNLAGGLRYLTSKTIGQK